MQIEESLIQKQKQDIIRISLSANKMNEVGVHVHEAIQKKYNAEIIGKYLHIRISYLYILFINLTGFKE